MPLVIDNENKDEIIARFVFDKDLFTVFFRRTSCGVGAEGENFLVEFNKDSVLRSYNPQVIDNDLDSRHRHFQWRDRKLSHVHVGFKTSIEHIEAVKAILLATNQVQQNVFENWSSLEKVYNEKMLSPICGVILFSNVDDMVAMAEGFFAHPPRLDVNKNFCFWRKSTGEAHDLNCKDLVTNIPTEGEIFDNVRNIVTMSRAAKPAPLPTAEPVNYGSHPILETGVSRLGEVELIALLLIFLLLLKRLARPVVCMNRLGRG